MGTQYLKPWLLAAVVAVFALAAGYVLPRPSRSGDMLDAVAAVQRHSPRFLVSEPMPPANWTKSGALFLCRTSRTAEELDGLNKHPTHADSRWAGILCFKATIDPDQHYVPWVADHPSNWWLDYGEFVVFGDADMLQEVRTILADAGFRLALGN